MRLYGSFLASALLCSIAPSPVHPFKPAPSIRNNTHKTSHTAAKRLFTEAQQGKIPTYKWHGIHFVDGGMVKGGLKKLALDQALPELLARPENAGVTELVWGSTSCGGGPEAAALSLGKLGPDAPKLRIVIPSDDTLSPMLKRCQKLGATIEYSRTVSFAAHGGNVARKILADLTDASTDKDHSLVLPEGLDFKENRDAMTAVLKHADYGSPLPDAFWITAASGLVTRSFVDALKDIVPEGHALPQVNAVIVKHNDPELPSEVTPIPSKYTFTEQVHNDGKWPQSNTRYEAKIPHAMVDAGVLDEETFKRLDPANICVIHVAL